MFLRQCANSLEATVFSVSKMYLENISTLNDDNATVQPKAAENM